MTRDGLTREAAEARIRAQHPDSFYEEHSAYLLHNGTSLAEFRAQCDELLPKLLNPSEQ
jgi:dephospho-CoA kinase